MTQEPIDFELRFDPATNKWRWRVGQADWSEALGFANLVKVLQTETKPPVPVEDWGKRRDGMPVVHSVKSQGPTADKPLEVLSEIYTRPDGTKAVRRIPSSATERQTQQMNELLALLEDGE